MVGTPMSSEDDIFNYLHQLGEQPGWHFKDQLAVNVSRSARSFRTPEPRFSAEKFSFEKYLWEDLTILQVIPNGECWKRRSSMGNWSGRKH